jgi:citrate synthase
MGNVDLLVKELMTAHVNSALDNDNLSSSFVKQMAAVGKSYTEAVASAVLSLGGTHGPTAQARQVLFNADNETIVQAIEEGVIIPGFGNAFYKDDIDPAWREFRSVLETEFPEVAARIEEVADILSSAKDKKLFPNPAVYTAATAHLMGMLPGTEIGLGVIARIPAWAQQWHENS